MVVAILGNAKTVVSQGARLSTDFVLVPKLNLFQSAAGAPASAAAAPDNSAAGAPDWLQEWIVDEIELRATYHVPPDSDFSQHFICDGNIPAEVKGRLGKRLKKIAFEENAMTSMSAGKRDRQEEDPQYSAAGAPGPSAARAPRVAANSDLVTLIVPTGAAAGAPEVAAAGAPAGAAAGAPAGAAASEEPGIKRQRILKILRSEEQQVDSEEAENVILEELIKKIKKAAAAKLLYSEDPQCASTVHFWSMQVLAAMKASQAVPDGSAAAAPDGSAAAAPEKAQLIKKHFAGFLLRLLYGARCYYHFKHFIPVFEGLASVGCVAPAAIGPLKVFATTDLEKPVSSDSFYEGADLTDRLRFFGSALYKDYLDCRMSALLEAGKKSTEPEHRQNLFASLVQLCASAEETTANADLIKQAQWATTLVGSGAPADRVKFALEAHADDRIALACEFKEHSTEIDWNCLKVFADPSSFTPDIGAEAFIACLDQLNRFGARKVVQHPVGMSLLDFRSDIVGLCAPGSAASAPEWATQLTKVVVKTKIEATSWTSVPDSWDCTTADPAMITVLARIVGKVWPHKGPEWVSTLRKEKENAKAAAAGAPVSAGKAPGSVTFAPEQNQEQKKDEEDKDKAKDDDPHVEDKENAEEQANADAAAGAPGAAAVAPDFVVGDIVKLDSGVGQKFQLQEAQIISVSKKMAKIRLLNLNNEVKQFPQTNLCLVHPSSLREADSAAAAPASAASAPKTASSSSAAAAPASAASALEQHLNDEKYTELLFGNVD